jgi:integrase
MSVYKRFDGKRVKRGDKNYDRATWYYRFKMNGVLYHQSIPEAETLKDAENAETSVKSKIFNNRYNPAAEKITFKMFAEDVFKPYAEKKNVSFKTIEIFITRMVAHFGKKFLRDIKPTDVRKYQEKLANRVKKDGEPISPQTVNLEMSSLKHLFNLAIEDDLIDKNPCRSVKPLRKPEKRDRILSEAERVRFWREVDKDLFLKNIVEIAVYTGIREGQVLALKVSDIDFDKYRLKIIPSKGREKRTIPINQKAWNVLKRASEGRTDFLFVSQRTSGKLKRFEKKWSKALEDAEISDFRFHDLRHEFGTSLMKSGVPQVAIKELLGHSTTAQTDIYTNADFDYLAKMVKMLDDEITETDTIA